MKKKKPLNIIISDSVESVLEPYEKRMLDLSLGRVEPETEDEKILLAQIKAIEAKGHMLDIPNSGF